MKRLVVLAMSMAVLALCAAAAHAADMPRNAAHKHAHAAHAGKHRPATHRTATQRPATQPAARIVDAKACLGPEAPDLFCRSYGYRRGSDTYARCASLIAGYGPGPALSNGYTINYDFTKTLPPRMCRPPHLVIEPPENLPL